MGFLLEWTSFHLTIFIVNHVWKTHCRFPRRGFFGQNPPDMIGSGEGGRMCFGIFGLENIVPRYSFPKNIYMWWGLSTPHMIYAFQERNITSKEASWRILYSSIHSMLKSYILPILPPLSYSIPRSCLISLTVSVCGVPCHGGRPNVYICNSRGSYSTTYTVHLGGGR